MSEEALNNYGAIDLDGGIHDRNIAAVMILQSVGEAFKAQPEETGFILTVAGTAFSIHGIFDDDDGFSVMVSEAIVTDMKDPVLGLCIMSEDEDNRLMYARYEDDDNKASDQALLVRAALEQKLGVSDMHGDLRNSVQP